MDDPGNKGVLRSLSPIEGPFTRMGRRGSFQTVETTSINIPGVGFSSNDSQQNPSLDFAVKAFEFVKSVASEPARKISGSDNPQADESMDPMKYKRTRARRVSLITSDGLKMDFLAPGGQDNKKKLEVAFVPVDQLRTVNLGENQNLNSDEGQSLTQIVETKRIEAASGSGLLSYPTSEDSSDVDDDLAKADLPSAHPEADQSHHNSLSGKILNHWFFKNPQEVPKPSTTAVDGIGHGQLTSKVVSALSIQTDRNESRKMNMWMPQGM